MWWSSGALAAAALFVAGCALTPVYGPGGGARALFGQVRIADPVSLDDAAFDQRMLDRMGGAGDRYGLARTLRIGVVPQAITAGEVATRYALNGTAVFTLTDAATGAVLAQGQVSNFTSYSTTGTTIATLAAESDARQRLARMLADQVVTRLLAAAATAPPP